MIIYASRTNNVRSVSKRIKEIKCVDIKEIREPVGESFFIFTYTDGIGQVPKHVEEFLDRNQFYLRGVIASGNLNFGNAFCGSADAISSKYNVPIIDKLDLRGNKDNIVRIVEEYNRIILK